MDELLEITTDEQGSLVVSSKIFADGLGISHKSLLESIRTHQTDIEGAFGLIAFETRKGETRDSPFETANLTVTKRSTKPVTVAYLTEDQALTVGALSRNSKRVVSFKITLVKSFAEARKRLQTSLALAPELPALVSDSLLLQLLDQNSQILATQQQMITSLQTTLDRLLAQPATDDPFTRLKRTQESIALPSERQLSIPGLPVAQPRPSSLRQTIHVHITQYARSRSLNTQTYYNRVYQRLYAVYGINVNLIQRAPGESILEALERLNYLDKVYNIVVTELDN